MAAHKLKIPTILHESNAFPGKAVKMLAKKTDVIMVSFEEARKRIPNAKKIVHTGTPTRIITRHLNLDEKIKLKEKYGLNPAKPMVLAFGGSQGAKTINNAVVDLCINHLNKNYQILLASGEKQYEIIKKELESKKIDIKKIDGLKIVPYIYELQEVMDVSDIVVSRSGAITITEIANLGKPSILIPLPNVSHNHQRYNAEVLENVKAAKIIQDSSLNKDTLNKEIESILLQGNLEEMGQNAKKTSVPNVQEKIYEEIRKIIN